MSPRKAIVALAAVPNHPRILHARDPVAMPLQDLQEDALPPEVVKMPVLEMPREQVHTRKPNRGRKERKKKFLDQLEVRDASEIQKTFHKQRLEAPSAQKMQKRFHKQRLDSASSLRHTLFKVWGNLDVSTQNRLLGKVGDLAALMEREHELKQLCISVKKEHMRLAKRLDAYEARATSRSS